ncbi:hypothetical protein GTA08_BOTSDO00100 [Botryosphaeria dothidea]|uniref:Uncharacterized protein n=1 Tax=Botryosphaeria dothidea TaxID=55169 RepID=A0A8H4N9D3_9PEZI|nr:hypothetical protein GTA08_BOTSDO00100 [Botryosphaeria dothidea]
MSVTQTTRTGAQGIRSLYNGTYHPHHHRQRRASSPPILRFPPFTSLEPFTTLEAALRSVSVSPQSDGPPSPYYDRSPPPPPHPSAAAPLRPASSDPVITSSSSSPSPSHSSLLTQTKGHSPTSRETDTIHNFASPPPRLAPSHSYSYPSPSAPSHASPSPSSQLSSPALAPSKDKGRMRGGYTWPLRPSGSRGDGSSTAELRRPSSAGSDLSSESDESGSSTGTVGRGLAVAERDGDAALVPALAPLGRSRLPPGIDGARGFKDARDGGNGGGGGGGCEDGALVEAQQHYKQRQPPGAAAMMMKALERRRSEGGDARRGYKVQCAACGRCRPERSRYCCSWPPLHMFLFGACASRRGDGRVGD